MAGTKRKTRTQDDSISALETRLTAAVAANGSLNPLADLLDIARNDSGVVSCSKAIYALYRVFVVIIAHGLLLRTDNGADEGQAAVRAWLHEKFDGYVSLLAELLSDDEDTLKVRLKRAHILATPTHCPSCRLLPSRSCFLSRNTCPHLYRLPAPLLLLPRHSLSSTFHIFEK